jgi:hypothetical protein
MAEAFSGLDFHSIRLERHTPKQPYPEIIAYSYSDYRILGWFMGYCIDPVNVLGLNFATLPR